MELRTVNKVKDNLEVGNSFRQNFPAEKLEKRVRLTTNDITPEIQALIDTNIEKLVEIFGTPESPKDSLVFHGTGYYHYDFSNKYFDSNSVDTNDIPIRSVLLGILEKGLAPSYDPWLPGISVNTTSLTKNYFYALWYADKNSTEQFKWNYGNPNDWFNFFLADTLKAEFEMSPKELFEKRNRIKGFGENVRKEDKFKGNKLQSWIAPVSLEALRTKRSIDLLKIKSDIKDNFGCILVYDESPVEKFKMEVGNSHEIRTTKTLSSFPEAILVPLDDISKLKEHFRGTIIPIEAVNAYLSKFPFKFLTKRN
ncbi:MAG: hypothetical protein WCK31_02540 [bacterium]